ncbi:MAG: outer membrane protein assembly factor BamD [Candidatus Cloacimonas sp.]|jgi:outer membrane protein assembly factor BamD|nr:outer membrane protein assembly factor BamD [Candidatus Cloacimonas sp.]
MRRYLIILFILLLGFTACSKNKTQLTTEARLKTADELFGRGKYARAALLYDEISFERKSASTAHATLRQADCYFEINKFGDAKSKYEQFIGSFPDHQDVSSAYYKIGVCLYEESLPPQYDQNETIECIEAFRLFIEKFPSDKRYTNALDYIRKSQYKLLEKTYLTGYIYYKMKDYSAALMYFEEIITLGNTDSLDRKSLYYSAKLHLHQKNREKARSSYDSLLERYAGSKEAKRLARHFK